MWASGRCFIAILRASIYERYDTVLYAAPRRKGALKHDAFSAKDGCQSDRISSIAHQNSPSRLQWYAYLVTFIQIHPPIFTVPTNQEPDGQSNGRMASFPRTSVAKLLCTPAVQFGTSNVVVWHHGFSVSSFSITRAKCCDQPLRGNLPVVVSINFGWMRFARLKDRVVSHCNRANSARRGRVLTVRCCLDMRACEVNSRLARQQPRALTEDSRELQNLANHSDVPPA